MVKCVICGLEMKDRINGSHLLRKHNMNIGQYSELYPEADLGVYTTGIFKCLVCGEIVSSNSEVKNKHLRTHKLTSIEYKLQYEKKKCKCGCGHYTEFSTARNTFNKYIDGHSIVWNLGSTKESNISVAAQSEKMKNGSCWCKGLTIHTSDILKRMGEQTTERFKSDDAKKSMVRNIKKAMLAKYGVENANDCPQFWHKFKEYTLPSGNVVKVQGYENYALDILLKYYDENDVVISRKCIPRFKFLSGKSYTPDIFITSNSTIYEVKSTWTYTKFEHEQLKADVINKCGYDYVIMVFDGKKRLVNEIKYNKL